MGTLVDKALMYVIVTIFKVTSTYLGRMLEAFFSKSDIEKGKEELERLKRMPAIYKLQFALRKYDHISDPLGGKLNVLFPLWLVCLKKQGDCDDAAFLMAEILKGQIWIIVKKITNSDAAGHAVFLDSKGNLWSNFKLDKKWVKNIEDVAKDYVSHPKYLVRLSKDIKIKEHLKQ